MDGAALGNPSPHRSFTNVFGRGDPRGSGMRSGESEGKWNRFRFLAAAKQAGLETIPILPVSNHPNTPDRN